MRVEEIHGGQQCVSEPRRERARGRHTERGREEDRTIIMKGLHFDESLRSLFCFFGSLISSTGGRGDFRKYEKELN